MIKEYEVILREKIQQLLDCYDSSQTECDGMTRICHTVLTNHGIEHQPMIGVLIRQNQEIEPHFWIDLASGERIDYRAKMWLQGENIPHGIFYPQDFPDVIYTGEPIELEVLSPVVFEILTLKIDYEKFQQGQAPY
ncbi:hypothetical protein ACN23B_30655 (plasmid) [Anabaena sp. FACHB-709]|uniref:Uncharacterized protein n=2 Tax=Nostocaceae TaxID=1162 RepID=A0A1Z4KWU9_ANAVA|nr:MULTISPECIES: hypothetical protein [Nostocaceae]BAY73456.1 hypothetical protein NIES23_63080 [Trichormus variabilis NIES-23]MBD2174619.1 hypothetical protein [Anabaena cylindrica FACHB-318]MBD2266330.1 hypothetical protein [Anabaena sp. FACHB-709]MBD2275792.1 hypothetical protein [Nostoc sp. PCC 7120 = FACHB-418]MBD2286960.1 hypothetical protein [Anabaena cylindrica FACHB-170]